MEYSSVKFQVLVKQNNINIKEVEDNYRIQ